jgi:hypothetical protein
LGFLSFVGFCVFFFFFFFVRADLFFFFFFFFSPVHSADLPPPPVLADAFPSLLARDMSEVTLLAAAPAVSLASSMREWEEIVFEELGFGAYLRVSAPTLATHDPEVALAFGGGGAGSAGATPGAPPPAAIVVDAGHTGSRCAAVYDGHVLEGSVRRLDVGGRMLTNLLKESISHRAIDVMEETFVVNDIKEKLCVCSLDYDADVRMCAQRGGPGAALRAELRVGGIVNGGKNGCCERFLGVTFLLKNFALTNIDLHLPPDPETNWLLLMMPELLSLVHFFCYR